MAQYAFIHRFLHIHSCKVNKKRVGLYSSKLRKNTKTPRALRNNNNIVICYSILLSMHAITGIQRCSQLTAMSALLFSDI